MLHPDDRARVGKKLESVMAAREETYTDEYRVVHPDGTVRWMVETGQFFMTALVRRCA
ncbi:MAG: PAS domain-containing protein [Nitrospiraceae bacterium]